MERSVAVVAAVVVAVTLAAVPSGGLAQPGDASVAPGERFAGVVGMQEAEVEGEVATRAFEVRFARADSAAAQAAVVAEGVNDTRERLRELEHRRERLRAARANGTISEGQYRARMARLYAEAKTLRHRLNRTADASREVPDAALRRHGVDRAELERLRRAAGNLTGPEIAAIARGIAGGGRGPPVGASPGRAGAGANGSDRGPPSAANGSDRGPPADGSERAAGSRSQGNETDAGAPDRSGGDSGSGNETRSGNGNAGERSDSSGSDSVDGSSGGDGTDGNRSGSGDGSDGSAPADGQDADGS